MQSKNRAIRLLYTSNGPWAKSGYGVQGASLLPRLAQLPEIDGRENIGVFAWYGLHGGIWEWNGFKIYPGGPDQYGNDVIKSHTDDFAANVVVSLIDVWVMQDTANKVKPALWCPWLPIDHDPVPDAVFQALQGSHMPLTYSKWGHEMLKNAGVQNRYIPHGIETSIYRVLDAPDAPNAVDKFKQSLVNGCQHLTVMVAANKGYPDRKAFQVQLRAWAEFAKDKPGAKLYIHTDPTRVYGGIDFQQLLGRLGLQDRVYFPHRYQYLIGHPTEYMSMLYNAADIYLGAAMSEGFGIPIIEAQACGTPVIVSNCSSMPELVRWGIAVDPADKFWSPLGSWQWWPSAKGIYEALESIYVEWHDNGDEWSIEKQLDVQNTIHEEYSWSSIVRKQWRPLITQLSGVVVPREITESMDYGFPKQADNTIDHDDAIPSVSLNGSGPEKVLPLHKLGVTKVEAE